MRLCFNFLPNLIQIPPLLRLPFAHIAEIRTQHAVRFHPTVPPRNQPLAQMALQNLGLQIPRQVILGIDQQNVIFQTAREVAQLHVRAGLKAEQHLAHEFS